MSIQSKRRALSFLKAFNYIGLIVLLFLTFQILSQIKSQAVANNLDNAKFAERIEKDHDLQNKYLQCLVNLFIEADADVVTPEQSALCLAQVRETTVKTTIIEPTVQNGQTTTSTTTTQSSPEDAAAPQNVPQSRPAQPPATTSAPPDPPAPSLIETLTNPIKELL